MYFDSTRALPRIHACVCDCALCVRVCVATKLLWTVWYLEYANLSDLVYAVVLGNWTIGLMDCLLSLEFGVDAMKDAILSDDITTLDQWMDIVKHCHDNGHMADFASRLLATITVNFAVKNASKNLQDIPVSK